MRQPTSLIKFSANVDRPRLFMITFAAMERIRQATGFDFVSLARNPAGMPADLEFCATMLTEFAREADPQVSRDSIRKNLTLRKVLTEIGPAIHRAVSASAHNAPAGPN